MCLPILGAIALAATAASAVVGTVGAINSANNQKKQLGIQQQTDQQNAALAAQNVALAKQNAETAAKTASENSQRLLDITDINANTAQAISDLNVGMATSISNFNLQVADGQQQMLIGQGEINASAQELNAQSARFNAGQSEDTAQAALKASGQQEQTSRLNYARLKSTQTATLAANGVVLGEGSALRIQTDTDFFSDVDAATIHANGVRAALGYRAQETNFLMTAREDDIGASVARLNAATQAASVKAQALGAKMASDRDVENMKLSTSFEILQMKSNAEISSANILNEGRKEAQSYEMQAAGFGLQENSFTGAADAAGAARSGINPFMSGVSSFLDGAASVATKWYGYSKAG